MRRVRNLVPVVAILVMGASCATLDVLTVDVVDDTNHVIDVPRRIDQEEWTPVRAGSAYSAQSLLYSELGSRFYNVGEREIARLYFENAIKFDRYNSQAHFALGEIAFRRSDYVTALFHFQQIRRQPKVAPYDIDYHAAAQMFLDFFPFQARVTAINPAEYASERPVVIINRGREHGVNPGMEFIVYREGSEIRNVESMEVIGMQRTTIARGVVRRTNPKNSEVEIFDQRAPLYVQLDDLLETDYLSQVPEPVYNESLGADMALGAGGGN